MSRESRQAEPRYLLRETRVEKAVYEGDGDRTSNHWYPFAEYHEVEAHVAASDRPGYGTDVKTIRYQVYDLTLEFCSETEMPPLTMADAARELVPYDSGGCTRLGPGLRVDVELRSVRNTPAVFWDSRHNSFVIVKPPAGDSSAVKRLTSDQGVMLLSVNGGGEIRWDVDAGSAKWQENAEAVAYFKLTWYEGALGHGRTTDRTVKAGEGARADGD
jgi:hypothetical protein